MRGLSTKTVITVLVSISIDAFELNIETKWPQYEQRYDKINSPAWQCSTSYRTGRQNDLGNVEMGSSTPSAVFSWYLRLSLVPINDTGSIWAEVLFIWKYPKIDRFVDSLKRCRLLSTRNSYVVRKMRKSNG